MPTLDSYVASNSAARFDRLDLWTQFIVGKDAVIGVGVEMTDEFVQTRADRTVLPLKCAMIRKHTFVDILTSTRTRLDICSVNGTVKSVNGAITWLAVRMNTTSLRCVISRWSADRIKSGSNRWAMVRERRLT